MNHLRRQWHRYSVAVVAIVAISTAVLSFLLRPEPVEYELQKWTGTEWVPVNGENP